MATEGTTTDELVGFIHLAPTMLSLAGITVPKTMQGWLYLGPNQTTTSNIWLAFAIEWMSVTTVRERFAIITICTFEIGCLIAPRSILGVHVSDSNHTGLEKGL
jgi:hypothetical protein